MKRFIYTTQTGENSPPAKKRTHASNPTSLGMARVEKAVESVKKKISFFGLTVENPTLVVVSDGASVMKKFVCLLEVEQQICLAHGLHVGVCDALYK